MPPPDDLTPPPADAPPQPVPTPVHLRVTVAGDADRWPAFTAYLTTLARAPTDPDAAAGVASVMAVTQEGIPTRLTDRARKVLARAREAARGLGHPVMGTGHLLAGLVGNSARPSGVAGHVLQVDFGVSWGVVVDYLRVAYPTDRGRNDAANPVMGPGFAEAVKLSQTCASGMGHSYVGTEHLLLGALSAPGAVFGQILLDIGVDTSSVNTRTRNYLGVGIVSASPAESCNPCSNEESLPEAIRGALSELAVLREADLSRLTAYPAAVRDVFARAYDRVAAELAELGRRDLLRASPVASESPVGGEPDGAGEGDGDSPLVYDTLSVVEAVRRVEAAGGEVRTRRGVVTAGNLLEWRARLAAEAAVLRATGLREWATLPAGPGG